MPSVSFVEPMIRANEGGVVEGNMVQCPRPHSAQLIASDLGESVWLVTRSFSVGPLAGKLAYGRAMPLSNREPRTHAVGPRHLLATNARANMPLCTDPRQRPQPPRRSQLRPEHRPNVAQPVPNAVVRRNKTALCLPQVVRAPHTKRGIMEQFETILRGAEAAAPFDKGRAEGIFSTPTHCAQLGR